MQNIFSNNYFIAHRGLHNPELPENSLGAFENAINYGYAIELDIQLLSDNTIAVHHDDDLIRSCNKNILLSDLKGEDLKSLHIFGTNFTIPTIQNVLELVNGKVPILIEIKPTKKYKRLIKTLSPILKNYKGEIAIQSFNPFILRHCKKHNKSLKLGYLCSKLEDIPSINKITKKILYSLMLFKISKADFISVKKDEITPKIINKSKGNIVPWVVTSKEEVSTLKSVSKGIIFENFLPK